MIPPDPRSTKASIDGRWRRASLLVVVVGCGLRLAYAFPVHKYAADADCLNPGLQAFRILEGHWPVFLAGARIGCLVCYETASAFALFGISRLGIALAPLLSGCMLLAILSHLLQRILPGATAFVALLFVALPSPTYIFWTYMPNSYSETMLFCVAVLWLTDVIRQKGLDGHRGFALGLVAGLGWWNSPLILAALIPALAWLFWFRRDIPRGTLWISIGLSGFLAGASPWIAYNLQHPFASFHEEKVAIADEPLAVVSNFVYLVVHQFPELVASSSPIVVGSSSAGQRLLRALVMAIHGAAITFGAIAFAAWLTRILRRRGVGRPPPWAPLLLVAPAVCGLYVLSQAGMRRSWNVRYILPSYLSIAVLLALFIAWLGRRHAAAALIVAGMIVSFNVAGYALWWTPLRRSWHSDLEGDRSLITFLRANSVQAVCGDYWLSYPVNFLSHEAILGIPQNLSVDYCEYERRLGSHPLQWALIAGNDSWLHAWVARTTLAGAFAHPSPKYYLFIPDAASSREDPRRFLERVVGTLPDRVQLMGPLVSHPVSRRPARAQLPLSSRARRLPPGRTN